MLKLTRSVKISSKCHHNIIPSFSLWVYGHWPMADWSECSNTGASVSLSLIFAFFHSFFLYLLQTHTFYFELSVGDGPFDVRTVSESTKVSVAVLFYNFFFRLQVADSGPCSHSRHSCLWRGQKLAINQGNNHSLFFCINNAESSNTTFLTSLDLCYSLLFFYSWPFLCFLYSVANFPQYGCSHVLLLPVLFCQPLFLCLWCLVFLPWFCLLWLV